MGWSPPLARVTVAMSVSGCGSPYARRVSGHLNRAPPEKTRRQPRQPHRSARQIRPDEQLPEDQHDDAGGPADSTSPQPQPSPNAAAVIRAARARTASSGVSRGGSGCGTRRHRFTCPCCAVGEDFARKGSRTVRARCTSRWPPCSATVIAAKRVRVAHTASEHPPPRAAGVGER